MEINMNKIDFKLLAQIVASIALFGWGWLADNQVVVVGFAATVLAWLFNVLLAQKISLGKFGKTAVVFVVSVLVQLLIVHPAIPSFPGWDIAALVTYLGEWFALIQSVMLAAIVIYNALLDKVLNELPAFLRKQ
jgi:hypothetical protein